MRWAGFTSTGSSMSGRLKGRRRLRSSFAQERSPVRLTTNSIKTIIQGIVLFLTGCSLFSTTDRRLSAAARRYARTVSRGLPAGRAGSAPRHPGRHRAGPNIILTAASPTADRGGGHGGQRHIGQRRHLVLVRHGADTSAREGETPFAQPLHDADGGLVVVTIAASGDPVVRHRLVQQPEPRPPGRPGPPVDSTRSARRQPRAATAASYFPRGPAATSGCPGRAGLSCRAPARRDGGRRRRYRAHGRNAHCPDRPAGPREGRDGPPGRPGPPSASSCSSAVLGTPAFLTGLEQQAVDATVEHPPDLRGVSSDRQCAIPSTSQPPAPPWRPGRPDQPAK